MIADRRSTPTICGLYRANPGILRIVPIRHDRPSQDRDSDAIDASLVRALQADGRASINELARTLGVSRDLVSRRLGALVGREGLRVVAALDPATLLPGAPEPAVHSQNEQEQTAQKEGFAE